MRGEQRELVTRIELHVHLSKPPPDSESLPAKLKTVVSVRTARRKGKPAQNGQTQVRITSDDMLPMRKVETLLFQ